MGRWTFPEGGGEPIYIPDEGEGAGGMLGHLATGAARTLQDVTTSAPARLAGRILGMPGRFVTAWGHAEDPAGYQGTTDPIDYIWTGEREDPEDLASYGTLLAETMAAEGTIDEKGLAAKAIRAAGDLISEPAVLAGVARAGATLAARPGVRAPMQAGRPQPRPLGTRPIATVDSPLRSATAGGARRAPVAQGGPTPTARRAAEPPGPLPPIEGTPGPKPKGGPAHRLVKKPKPTKYRTPPIDRPSEASQWPSVPLDPDLAHPGIFTPGGVRKFGGPTAKDVRLRPARRAAKRAKKEQMAEGLEAMAREQTPGMGGPGATQPLPVPRAQIRAMVQAAVEQGASSSDIAQLIINTLPG